MDEHAKLVVRACQGEKDAFGELVDQYTDSVYAIAYGYAMNVPDARDLVQEIFIKAFRSMGSLRQPDQFRRWLFRLANRKCLDWLGKRQPTTYTDPINIDNMSPDRSPNAASESETHSEDVARVMARLPEEHRVVLTLRYLEGMCYERIADALDIHVDGVGNCLLRAKRYVKKHLSQLGSGG